MVDVDLTHTDLQCLESGAESLDRRGAAFARTVTDFAWAFSVLQFLSI
jgi:hypothetical protein